MKGLVPRAVAALTLAAVLGTAQSAPVFLGRLADGSASSTCTVSGVTKCTMFYNATLDITILNDWNIGRGFWSAKAVVGSAQAIARSAGFAATGRKGWVLPSGDWLADSAAENQYGSIWRDVGETVSGLQAQFDGVQYDFYWSRTAYEWDPGSLAWLFGGGYQRVLGHNRQAYAVAVRRGDVAPVPEPQTAALVLLALGLAAVVRGASKLRLLPRPID